MMNLTMAIEPTQFLSATCYRR